MLTKSFSILNYNFKRLISIQTTDKFDWMKQEKLLMEPFEYVQKLPCKHHTTMPSTFNYWLKVPEDKFNRITETVQAWITWATIFDDIQDNSEYRQGAPSAHRVFSVGAAINAANITLTKVLKQMANLGHPLASEIFMKRFNEVLYGEGLDIYWREKFICPPEEAHMEMTRKKCGAYYVLPVELMQLFSSNNTDYTNLAIDIGSYNELIDDYYNLFHPRALLRLAKKIQVGYMQLEHKEVYTNIHTTTDTSFAPKRSIIKENHMTNSDITEGKITLAVIHASQFPDVATELIDIYKQRTSDPKLQNRAITLMKKHGSDEYVRDKMMQLEEDIRAEIDRLGGNPLLTAYMDELCFQNLKPPPEQDLYQHNADF